MTQADRDQQARAERAREIALFRYALIREAADPALTTRQRGRLVRALACREHTGPAGTRVRVSRATIDRWIRDWRAGGFDALVPEPRRVAPRTPAELLELAVVLKKEAPARTAAQVAAVLRAHAGVAPSERTLQRHFVALGPRRVRRCPCPGRSRPRTGIAWSHLLQHRNDMIAPTVSTPAPGYYAN